MDFPACGQQSDLGGPDTIIPGSGFGTNVPGSIPGLVIQATNAEDAAKRQNLEPVIVRAAKMIGAEDRNPVIRILCLNNKRIPVEPGALVLRPGGDRFTAVLVMGLDVIAAAKPFSPVKVLAARWAMRPAVRRRDAGPFCG